MNKLYTICVDFYKEMSKQNISVFASSAAFFIFLSLIPMLIMICTIIPFTPLTENNLLSVIKGLTPSAFNPLLTSLVSQVYDKSTGILSIAALFTIWSAAKGVLALIRGLNAVTGAIERRNYVLLRFVASFYTIIVLLIIVLSLLVMVFGNVVVSVIVTKIPQTEYFFEGLMRLRFLMIWGFLTLIFTLMYAFMPSEKGKIKAQVPGATFSAVSWSVFSWGFSIYVDHYDEVNAYGSLSIIILIMLWIYFCLIIILVGAYINRYDFSIYKNIHPKIN